MHCFSSRLSCLCPILFELIPVIVCLWILDSVAYAQESPFLKFGRVTAGRFDGDGKQVILASEGSLKLLDLKNTLVVHNESGLESRSEKERFESGRSIHAIGSIEVAFPKITKMDFSPDKKSLLIAGGDPGQRGCIQVLQWPSGMLQRSIETRADGKPLSDLVMDIKWFADGSRWIETHWNDGALVRGTDGQILGSFSGHTGPVTGGLAWSSELAITGGIDQTIKLWRISDGEILRNFDNHTGAIIGLLRWKDPDSKALLVSLGRDRTLRLWDPEIGRLIRFVRLPGLPLKMDFSGNDGLVVLLESGKLSCVSLPDLAIQETVALEERSVTTLVPIVPRRWLYW